MILNDLESPQSTALSYDAFICDTFCWNESLRTRTHSVDQITKLRISIFRVPHLSGTDGWLSDNGRLGKWRNSSLGTNIPPPCPAVIILAAILPRWLVGLLGATSLHDRIQLNTACRRLSAGRRGVQELSKSNPLLIRNGNSIRLAPQFFETMNEGQSAETCPPSLVCNTTQTHSVCGMQRHCGMRYTNTRLLLLLLLQCADHLLHKSVNYLIVSYSRFVSNQSWNANTTF